jgi:hypothetical protein
MQQAFNVISVMSLSTQYNLTGHFIRFMAQTKLADTSLETAIKEFESGYGPIVVNYSLISPNQYDLKSGAEVFEYRTANSGPCSMRVGPQEEPKPLTALQALTALVQTTSMSGEPMSGMDIFYSSEWTIVKNYLTVFDTFDQFQTRVKNVYTTLENLINSSSYQQASVGGTHSSEFVEVVERGVTFFLRQYMQNYLYQLRINLVYACNNTNYMVMPILDFTPVKPDVPSFQMHKDQKKEGGRAYYTDRAAFERGMQRFTLFDLVYRYLRSVRDSASATNTLYKNPTEWGKKIAEYKAWKLTLGDRPTQQQMDYDAKQNIAPIFASNEPYEKWEDAETKYLTHGVVAEVETGVFPGRYSLFNLANGWSTFGDGAWSTLPNMVSSLSEPLDPSMSLPSI